MPYKLKVTGKGSNILLSEKYVTRVLFDSDIPSDSNARAADCGFGIKVWGKILFKLPAGGDPTLKLVQWSQVPLDNADCYRRCEAEIISAGQTVRQYTLTDAFVVEYSEKQDVAAGVGIFYLHVRQKKNENERMTISGGFSAEQ